MAIQFSRGEYWILELVSELRYSIGFLFGPPSHLRQLHNKPDHGLDRDGVIEVLLSLLGKEFISLEQHEKKISNPTKKLIENHLATKLPFSDRISYKLTRKGGEAWEEFAQPDWSRYISTKYLDYKPDELERHDTAEIICADKKWLDFYLKSLEQYQLKVIENSLVEEAIKPWKATYWKMLPKGYRVKFICQWNDEDYSPPPPMWFDTTWYRWR